MIPEMTDYYKLTTDRQSRCFPLEVVNAQDPRSLVWEFQIGDGEHKPTPESVESSCPGFVFRERYGKIVVTAPASEVSRMHACIYMDTRGNLWFIENPCYPVILPEYCIHFLITGIFSNIMRYRPDEWGNVLSNEVTSSISLITRHYFSSFQKKFFILVLRAASRYMPYAA
jgi:hypothetical protein